MIEDLDETIKNLLIAEIPIKNGEIDIKFEQPRREWSARLTRPTVNIFLFDIRENATLRQHQWQQISNGNGRLAEVKMKRSPYRVDCHYIMTAWATEVDDEHRMLSRCMLAMLRNPIIPEAVLAGNMQQQPFEVQGRIASHDKLTNPAEVWSALDNELRPSVSYLVTLALDPWTEVSGSVVRTFTLRTGQSDVPKDEEFMPETAATEKSFIGGQVSQKGKPKADIQVAIKGTGYLATSDENGRFRLGSLTHGKHTLVAWPATGKPKELKISVPADDYDIKL